MASILKVDTIQDQSGNNIINESADTITIGASGDTITIPAGATTTLTDGVSGDFKMNSGYGSVATAYGCRAWINFDGTGTPSIRGSGNVTSITDNSTGNYTINLTTALTDGNFSIVASASGRGTLTTPDTDVSVGVGPPTTSLSPSAFRIQIGNPNAQVDDAFITAAVFR